MPKNNMSKSTRLEKGGRVPISNTTVERETIRKPKQTVEKPSQAKNARETDTGTGTRYLPKKERPDMTPFPRNDRNPAAAGKKRKAKKRGETTDIAEAVRLFEKEYNNRAQNEKSPFPLDMQYDPYSGETTWERKNRK